MSPRLPGLPFEPYESLSERPHVMVDGAARPSSVLTLSHWPQSPTPPELARDVSASIVLEYLRLASPGGANASVAGARAVRRAIARGRLAEAVTNDHFDEDGLVSVFALVDPEAALAHAELLVAVATCGDFGVVHEPAVARMAFAIAPLAEAEAGAGSGTSERYRATLPRLGELLEHPERFERYFADELSELAYGQEAIAGGEVVITEEGALDLAIVERASSHRTSGDRIPGAEGGLPVHAAAVHSATSASRIIAFDGAACECYLRYEGWVKTVSRQVPLRPDLSPLAARLTAEEPSGLAWEANGVGAIVARLRPGGDGCSEIDPARIVTLVGDYLASADPAWDPWRAGGGHIPVQERPGYASSYGRSRPRPVRPARPRPGRPARRRRRGGD
ncbi:MAG: DUF6687 family protein [Acidimicrobiales bacterium]|jgi:hypothetical protein